MLHRVVSERARNHVSSTKLVDIRSDSAPEIGRRYMVQQFVNKRRRTGEMLQLKLKRSTPYVPVANAL